MTSEATQSTAGPASSAKPAVFTAASVLVLAITLTWAFLAKRAVMDVGGSCADGGPYVSAQSCPDGSYLIAIAIPVMLVTAMAGSAAALSISAPNLLLPMWGVPVGALGWNLRPRETEPGAGSRWWVPAYAALGSVGAVAGAAS